MKVCRFCNHEQESGDHCEACGSPLSADKVDFSDSSSDMMSGFGEFPDPTKSAFPDPTQQAFPDPTVSPSHSSTDYPVKQETQPSQEHVAGAAVAAFGTKDAPEKPMTSPAELMSKGAEQTHQEKGTDVSGTKAQDKADNVFGTQFPDPTQNSKNGNEKPKIMYSAAASGETVYALSKGSLSKNHTPVQPGPGWWNGAPNSGFDASATKANAGSTATNANKGENTPKAAQPADQSAAGQTTAPGASQNTAAQQETIPVVNVATQSQGVGTNPEFKPYESLYNHAVLSLGMGAVGLLCCCGMTIFSLIFSWLAYSRLWALKKGNTTSSATEVASQSKKFLLVADILLAISFVIMFIVVIVNA
ncbi:MAG: hypothetical protein IK020_12160 [Clostridiales bacterium]|nr:hypothetical protein [Clostridiales bacterium]